MPAPKVISLEVVVAPDGNKIFKAPTDMWMVGQPCFEGPEGKYYRKINAGCLGSNRAVKSNITEGYVYYVEEDSPCLLFRGGSFFDSGCIYYFGSQSNGYHLVQGFDKIGWKEKGKFGPPTDLLARWFEPGDVIVVAYYPHPNVLK